MGKVKTITRGGKRVYVDQDTGEKMPGVTSIKGLLPKDFLTWWAARLTAETAIDNRDLINQLAERDRDGAVEYLRNAHHRYTRQRSDRGSKAHDVFERIIRGERVRHVHPDVRGLVDQFRGFVDACAPELIRAEDVAWSGEHGYAGSFDAILRVWLDGDGKPTADRSGTPSVVMVDYKTGNRIYADTALQMAAYARAETVVSPDGTAEPMPRVDMAAIVHITDETWSFVPVSIGDEVFRVFLALRHYVMPWEQEISKAVLQEPIAGGGNSQTGTQRRA